MRSQNPEASSQKERRSHWWRRGFIASPFWLLAPGSWLLTAPLAWTAPIHLEYFRWYTAVLLFVVLGAPIVLLGMRSLSGLGPVRKWVAIGTRLGVLLLF